jgi:hypothetical protein
LFGHLALGAGKAIQTLWVILSHDHFVESIQLRAHDIQTFFTVTSWAFSPPSGALKSSPIPASAAVRFPNVGFGCAPASDMADC